MLKSLELRNFLKHSHLTVDFAAGLNVIRGENEGGKSSMLEGLGYNWFGTSALSGSMADTVRWGAKASDLRTKSEFTVEGVGYTCLRGPNGAELYITGEEKPLVTGQAEVTAKVESLFGLPPGKAMNIIFAQQNAIRGILSAGPTAAAEFIEKLGDFAQADQLVKSLVEKVESGSSTELEAQISETTSRLSALRAQEAELPDLAGLRDRVAGLVASAAEAKQQADAADTAYRDAVAAAKLTSSRRSSLNQMIAQIKSAQEGYASRRYALATQCEGLAEMRGKLDQLVDQQSLHSTYKAFVYFQGLPKFEDVWEGDIASLEAEMDRISKEVSSALMEAKGLRGSAKGMELTRITKTKCPTCGSSLADEAEVAAKNAELDKRLTSLLMQAEELERSAVPLNEELQLLASVRNNGILLLKEIDILGGLVTVNRNTVPAEISWVGPQPEPVSDPAADITALRAATQKAEQAKSALDHLSPPDVSKLADLENELAGLPPEASPADLEYQRLGAVRIRAAATSAESAAEAAKSELHAAETAGAVCRSSKEEAERSLAALEGRLKVLSANNALIKRVRSARLRVTERLWEHLLGTTSAFFGHFRGVKSVVSRGDKGAFLVDGKAGRPSGSTLDILGLSIRIAVARVFSKCGVLVLDEPSAGCDAKRTSLMTSGLLSAGFDQVILVTHKDADESAGGKLIQL